MTGGPPYSPEHNNKDSDELYGVHTVLECLKSGTRTIEKIYIQKTASGRGQAEILRLCREKGIPFRLEPSVFFERRTHGASHQGVLAVCSAQKYTDIEDILPTLSASPTVVILDSIEDPRNLGAILRTCAASGVDGVIVPKDHSSGLTSTVAKTSAGALDYIPVVRVANLVNAMKVLKEKGVWIVGIETGQPKHYAEMDYRMPLALVFGNEGKGMRRLVRENCDFLASIPTPGKIHSLNVSVAAGIVLYEVLRQRSGLKNP
ncbi:MAG: 23S rRNA (guanosine(2251)-2'-O)-methyltransferase RlmB [Terriglobia bacterium]